MTTLLFDTEAMDQTAGMLRDGAGEYQMLSSQVSADADLGSMPAQTAAWVADVISSISQALAQLTSDLSSDGELLAWRSDEARLADDPSLGAVAEAIFGTTSAGSSSSFAGSAGAFASGFDPLGVPAGCAGCVGGYAAVTYDPTGQEPTADTSSSAAWGNGSYESVYAGDAGDTVLVPLGDPWLTGPSDATTFEIPIEPIPIDTGYSDPSTSVVIPLASPNVGPTDSFLIEIPPVGWSDPSTSITVPVEVPSYYSGPYRSGGYAFGPYIHDLVDSIPDNRWLQNL